MAGQAWERLEALMVHPVGGMAPVAPIESLPPTKPPVSVVEVGRLSVEVK